MGGGEYVLANDCLTFQNHHPRKGLLMTDFPWSDYKPTRTDPAAEYEAARREFDERRYVPAAERLEWILEQPVDHRHGLGDVRELLARSYYHSARLKPAEEAARAILAEDRKSVV